MLGKVLLLGWFVIIGLAAIWLTMPEPISGDRWAFVRTVYPTLAEEPFIVMDRARLYIWMALNGLGWPLSIASILFILRRAISA